MLDTLNSHIEVKAFIDNSVPLKLLRSKNLSLIITFLYQTYKKNEILSVPYQQLIYKLVEFLEQNDDEEAIVGNQQSRPKPDFEEKSKRYINKWMEERYLRNIVDDQSKEPFVFLSKHVERVFQVFNSIREREFIGTESKFRDILHKLKDIIENANPDKETRLKELEKRKEQIQREIDSIKEEGFVSTYEDFQIKSRFEELNRLTNELVGDFKEVEDNFKGITRKIYEKQQLTDISKGKILSETFDALYELKQTDQGKSFYSFWQFMLDDISQAEFKRLNQELINVLAERQIHAPSRSITRLKTLLYYSARTVLDKNNMLADKLSREIVAKDQAETKRLRELMADIRTLAIKRQNASTEEQNRIYMKLPLQPDIYFPLELKLRERPESKVFSVNAEKSSLDITELSDLSKIYNPDLIDKNVLLGNIQQLLTNKSRISLAEVTEVFVIQKGLAELIAYVTLVNYSSKFFINAHIRERIIFDSAQGRYLVLPQILFTK